MYPFPWLFLLCGIVPEDTLLCNTGSIVSSFLYFMDSASYLWLRLCRLLDTKPHTELLDFFHSSAHVTIPLIVSVIQSVWIVACCPWTHICLRTGHLLGILYSHFPGCFIGLLSTHSLNLTLSCGIYCSCNSSYKSCHQKLSPIAFYSLFPLRF